MKVTGLQRNPSLNEWALDRVSDVSARELSKLKNLDEPLTHCGSAVVSNEVSNAEREPTVIANDVLRSTWKPWHPRLGLPTGCNQLYCQRAVEST